MLNPAKIHFSRTADAGYVFDAQAIEVTIFNRRGGTVWRKLREDQSAPILWQGLDLTGLRVEIGSYTCKIRYLHQDVYYPFVFAG